MLARTPWTPVVEKKAEKRIGEQRKRVLRDYVIEILRDGEPTHFAFEGACRHGLRVALVLNGWKWPLADHEAAAIVAAALAVLGAKRPTWQAGQPDYAQQGTLILREHCLNCGRPLLNQLNTKYCDGYCRNQWHSAMVAAWMRENGDAYRTAVSRARGLDEQHNAA